MALRTDQLGAFAVIIRRRNRPSAIGLQQLLHFLFPRPRQDWRLWDGRLGVLGWGGLVRLRSGRSFRLRTGRLLARAFRFASAGFLFLFALAGFLLRLGFQLGLDA